MLIIENKLQTNGLYFFRYQFSLFNWKCFYKQYIEAWCNGNTTDFGSVILGSNPSASSKIRLQIGSNSRPAEMPVVEQSIAAVTIKEDKSPW